MTIDKSIPAGNRLNCAAVIALAMTYIAMPPRSTSALPIPQPVAPLATPDRPEKLLAAGDQAGAEQVVQDRINAAVNAGKSPNVEDVFLAAVMTRSRFDTAGAAPLFQYVNQNAPNTPHGLASGIILKLDNRTPDAPKDFRALIELCLMKHYPDTLLLWMMAVQCRAYDQPKLGVDLYAELCKRWEPGPVLVHQTYANLLDELSRFDESLVQRRLAVKMEPAGWSYDGLGNTLTGLKRWQEADDAFSHSTALNPDDVQFWRNWEISKRQRGDAEGAALIQAKLDAMNNATANGN
jgi:tetratricopeptide (TPR) repeat protein